jgi:hypothetical protein
VRAEFADAELEKSLMEKCKSIVPVSGVPPIELGEQYTALLLYAKSLLEQRALSSSIDWKGLLRQYREVFIEHLIQVWAKFYTQLRDYHRDEPEIALVKIEADHVKLLKELEFFNVSELFGQILNAAFYYAPVVCSTVRIGSSTVFMDSTKTVDDGLSAEMATQIQQLRKKFKLSQTDTLEKLLRRIVVFGNLDELLMLIPLVPDISAKDENPESQKTALHLAVERNNVHFAQLLLSAGADPEVKDSLNKTPENYAHSAEMIALFNHFKLQDLHF